MLEEEENTIKSVIQKKFSNKKLRIITLKKSM